MKRNKKLFILPLFVLLLTSCDFLLFKASYIRESSESTSEQSLTTSISEESSTPPTSDGNIESSVPTTSEGSESSTPSISEPPVETRPTSGTETFSFYAINDLHGALHARPEIAEPGLAKAGALLKAKKQERPDNTVIISTGDMWQGTFEAYHSKGEVVTLAMNEIGFDLMAIGNHEFDWGPEYILDNIAVADFPFLGANIMKYPEITEKSPIGEEYVILERGHVKIGVIGMIGQNQMTSICSRLIEEIYFADMVPIVERLSTKLRNEEEVDIVVLAIHAGQDDVPGFLALDKYVDAVFNAHTHQHETKTVAGVPFIQGGSKGRYVSHIELEYDYAHNSVKALKAENINMVDADITPDSAVNALLNSYKAESDAISEIYVGEAGGYFDRYDELPRVLNYAVARTALELDYELDFVYGGGTREGIAAGTVTYGDLYKAHPFDNAIYVVSVSGRDLLAQQSYYQAYRVEDHAEIELNRYYTLAIQDYSILHQDITKTYNYFPGYNPDEHFIGIISDENGDPIMPRDLIWEEFRMAPNLMLDPFDYKYINERHFNFTIP